jgi:hypothetical protein
VVAALFSQIVLDAAMQGVEILKALGESEGAGSENDECVRVRTEWISGCVVVVVVVMCQAAAAWCGRLLAQTFCRRRAL